MIGSPQIGWWIAHTAFWVLMVMAFRDRRWRAVSVVMSLWIAGYVISSQVPGLSLFFMPYVAALDVTLVFIVLGRDIRLT